MEKIKCRSITAAALFLINETTTNYTVCFIPLFLCYSISGAFFYHGSNVSQPSEVQLMRFFTRIDAPFFATL